jgi:molybdate transport system ATP-binding protein
MLELDLAFRRGGFDLACALRLEGGVCLLHGPSGGGKTTLLDLLAGFLAPARGWIRLDGETLFDAEGGVDLRPERRRIGYLFQEGRLFPHLSVEGNVRYGLRRRRGDGGRGFDEVVDVLGLGGLLDRRPDALSGGERQRVALGRALLGRARLLLLDEPLAGLDPALRERILPYLARTFARFGLPVLYVSHFPGEVAGLADRSLRMEGGRLREAPASAASAAIPES